MQVLTSRTARSFALQGQDVIARGEALGKLWPLANKALEGRNIAIPIVSRSFRAFLAEAQHDAGLRPGLSHTAPSGPRPIASHVQQWNQYDSTDLLLKK